MGAIIRDVLTAIIVATTAVIIVPLIAAIAAISHVCDEMRRWL